MKKGPLVGPGFFWGMKYYRVKRGIISEANIFGSLLTNQDFMECHWWVFQHCSYENVFLSFMDSCCLFVKSHEISISLTSGTWVCHLWIISPWTYQNMVKTKMATSLSFQFFGIHLFCIILARHKWLFFGSYPPQNLYIYIYYILYIYIYAAPKIGLAWPAKGKKNLVSFFATILWEAKIG